MNDRPPEGHAAPLTPVPSASGPTDESRAGRALVWKGLQLGLSKMLYLVGTLVLGHLLTPGDFGLVAIATVAITTVMTATDTGMTSALVQASVREQIHYDVAWTVGMFRGLAVCLVLLLTAPLVAALFGNAEAEPLIRLMAFVPLISSIASPRLADLIRELRFSRLAVVAIAGVLVELGVSISLAGRLGGEAIILGKLGGAVVLCVLSYCVAPHRPRIRVNFGSSRQLISFGRWLFAIGLTAVAADLFLKVLISRILGVGELGLFSLADRLAETPNQLANEAVGAVAFPLYARLRDDPGRVQAVLGAHITGLMFFVMPATALVIALAQPLEQRVLGPAWVGTSHIIVLLALAYALEVAFHAISPLLQAFGAGARLFKVEVLQYVALIASVAVLASSSGLFGVGVARMAAALVVVFAGARAASALMRPVLPRVLRTGACLVVLAALAGTAAWYAARLLPGATGVIAGALCGGAVFLALTWFGDAPLGIRVRESLAIFFPLLADRPAAVRGADR